MYVVRIVWHGAAALNVRAPGRAGVCTHAVSKLLGARNRALTIEYLTAVVIPIKRVTNGAEK